MAQEQRFPSPSNVAVDQKGKPVQAKPQAKQADVKPVVGSKIIPIEILYKGENTVVLFGVHSIMKGLNTVPSVVWEKAKGLPSVVALMKSGQLSLVGQASSPASEKKSLDEVPASKQE